MLRIGLQSSNFAMVGIGLQLFASPLMPKATVDAVAFEDASLAILAKIITQNRKCVASEKSIKSVTYPHLFAFVRAGLKIHEK